MDKLLIVDAYDTTLVLDNPDYEATQHERRYGATGDRVGLYEPYEELLREMKYEDPLAIMKQDRELLLAKETSFAEYLAKYKPKKWSDAQTAETLKLADIMLQYHYNAYKPAAYIQEFVNMAAAYNIKVALLSNLAVPYVRAIEDKLPMIQHKFYSCKMGLTKPHKEAFHYVCKEMGVAPKHAVMLGNSYKSDVCGALDAGLYGAIFMDHGLTECDAQYRVQDLSGVEAVLKQIKFTK